MFTACDERGISLVFVLLLMVLTAGVTLSVTYVGGLYAHISFNEKKGMQAFYTAEAGVQHALWRLRQDPAWRAGFTSQGFGPSNYGEYTVQIQEPSAGRISITSTGTSMGLTKVIHLSVDQGQVFQPGPLDGKDAYLNNELGASGRNYGADSQIHIGKSDLHRALFQFDLSSIPSTTEINNAVFKTYLSSTQGMALTSAIELYRITNSWKEGQGIGDIGIDGATWTNRDLTTQWVQQGGDYSLPFVASTDITKDGVGWYTWDLSPLVQGWINGAYPTNDGFLLKASSNTVDLDGIYYSSDYTGVPTLRPELIVIYPGGGDLVVRTWSGS
jgi:hypothetical protein